MTYLVTLVIQCPLRIMDAHVTLTSHVLFIWPAVECERHLLAWTADDRTEACVQLLVAGQTEIPNGALFPTAGLQQQRTLGYANALSMGLQENSLIHSEPRSAESKECFG